ncbi:MAG: dephospho-CoA kinase [Clostridia bacterium]|nr:dephospho-CoA kinase [Clostridia bacterium]
MRKHVVVGLTGYTGAGKSAAAQIFRALGAYIIDADELAHRVVAPGQPTLDEICRVFGQEMLLPDGTLHRRALGSLVFADAKKRKQLEQITHPQILALTRQELQKAGGADVVLDAPVLFEVPELVKLCDKTVFVDAAQDVRLRRIMKRDGISAQEAQQRIDAQAFMEAWKAQCDLVVDNSGEWDQLEETIQNWTEVQRGRHY